MAQYVEKPVIVDAQWHEECKSWEVKLPSGFSEWLSEEEFKDAYEEVKI